MKKQNNNFFEHKGGLSEKFNAVLRYQENQGIPPKLKDRKTGYWDLVEHQELEQKENQKGAKLYKILNLGRNQDLRSSPPFKNVRTGCLLCVDFRHPKDKGILIDREWEAKANIYPVLKGNHGILIHKDHIEQKLELFTIIKVLNWAKRASDYRFFYNGKQAGATITDHLHIQFFKTFEPFDLIGDKSPIEIWVQDKNNLSKPKKKQGVVIYSVKNYPISKKAIKVFFIKGDINKIDKAALEIDRILRKLDKKGLDYNLFFKRENNLINTFIFPRTNKQFGVKEDKKDKTAKIKKGQEYLLGKDIRTQKRTKSRVFAAIEFSGIFVSSDKEQYQKFNYDDFVYVLNELGLKHQCLTPGVKH